MASPTQTSGQGEVRAGHWWKEEDRVREYVDRNDRAAAEINEVFGLTTQMILAFGVIFELPIFVLFLSLSGIVTARQLFSGTRYAIVASFVIGAILTPPDVVSQVLMSVPMVILYLLGVAVAWMLERKPAETTALQKTEG